MFSRDMKKSLSTNQSIVVFPYAEGAEPVTLEGSQSSLVYEFSLKPGVDRVYLKGFSQMPVNTFFTQGFVLRPMYGDDLTMAFDVETSTFSNERGIGMVTIIGKRKFDSYLDKPCEISMKGKLSAVLIKIFGEKFSPSIELSGEGDPEISLSSPKGRTRRDVVDSLARQYEFLWCASIWNDKEVLVFKDKFGVDQTPSFPENMRASGLSLTPIGWFGAYQESIIPPGVKMNFDGQEMLSAFAKVNARPGIGIESEMDFLDTDLFKYFSYAHIKKCKSIQRRARAEPDAPKDPFYAVLATKEKDGLLDGTYVDMKTQFDVVGNDNQGSAVGGIIQSSPWATIGGSGMTFPYNLGTRETIVAAPTDTRSVAIADIANSVDNGSGKKFVLNFKSVDRSKAGSLEFNTSDGTWTITGEGIILGAGASKGLALADHKHSTSALIVASLGAPSTVTGGLGASDSNTSVVKAK